VLALLSGGASARKQAAVALFSKNSLKVNFTPQNPHEFCAQIHKCEFCAKTVNVDSRHRRNHEKILRKNAKFRDFSQNRALLGQFAVLLPRMRQKSTLRCKRAAVTSVFLSRVKSMLPG